MALSMTACVRHSTSYIMISLHYVDENVSRAIKLLRVVASAVGVYLGYPPADPVIGILMTILILGIVWESSVAVFTRILDGSEPDVRQKIKKAAQQTDGVDDVSEVHVRWLGDRMRAELNVTVGEGLTVEKGQDIACAVRHDLLHERCSFPRSLPKSTLRRIRRKASKIGTSA